MKQLRVDAPGGRYPIRIARGAIDGLPRWIARDRMPSSINVFSDATVDRLHGDRVGAALSELDVPLRRFTVPAGEASKSTRQLERLWRGLVRAGIDRHALVVALGGGVVGDLAGFVAASVLRGIEFVQVPTTLLAMVDSSVGGKTGINLPEGKNLIGAFHQPRAVFADLDFLETLPRRELRAGWAEVIKTAAIGDARLFSVMERDAATLLRGEPTALAGAIRSTCRVKARVVSDDEREVGLRMILNYGHTLGHGIESAAGYGDLLHGEAVAIGMVFAARFGAELGVTPRKAAARIEALVKRYGLPRRVPETLALKPKRVLDVCLRDKKVGPDGPRWVFVPKLGSASVHDDVSWSTAESAIRDFLAPTSTQRRA